MDYRRPKKKKKPIKSGKSAAASLVSGLIRGSLVGRVERKARRIIKKK